MIKTFRITVFLVILSVTSSAQNAITDSLKKIALRVEKDSAAKLYVKIANVFTGVNSDSVRKYAQIASNMATANSVVKGDVLIQFGNSYHMESKMDSALMYYNKALVYFQKIANDKGVAKAYQSFAIVKRSTGDIEGAIIDSKKAYDVYNKINWNIGKVNVLNNISNAYMSLHKYNEAVVYSRQSLSLSKILNDSLKYFTMLSEYGGKLMHVKMYDSASYYIKAATPFLERNGLYYNLLVLNSNLATIYYDQNKDFEKAKEYLYNAIKYSSLSGATDNLSSVYKQLSYVYIIQKNVDSAFTYLDKMLYYIDSVNNQKALDITKELQTKYETEKKELQIKNQSIEIEAKEKQNKQKSLIILFGTLALLGTGFFAAMAYINFKKTKRANIIIENQKQEVELKNEEITHQKEIVEEKQKEIIDSINYAKRIQTAVLTGKDVWDKVSKDHFILFKPKDIVSGDFYWAYNTPNNRSIFVLADCTGHGVPGGFMSMLGNSFLNEIVVENKLFKANEILNKLRAKIIAALDQEGKSEQKDGMDISLCVWNKIDNTLEFSGAHNPIWILSNGELNEVKADKMPIGSYIDNVTSFNSSVIQLQAGDIIYMSTDGYADQFGGPKGKKLKYKAMLELMIANSKEPMSKQKEILESYFESWRQNYEQVDDVSVIGVRV